MLSVFLIFLLGFLSLTVWSAIGMRWRFGLPALEPAPRNRSPWLPLACVMAWAFVGLMLFGKVQILLGNADEPTTIDLPQLIRSVADGAINIIIALAVLTAGGRFSLRDVGIRWQHLGRQLLDGLFGFLASLAPVALMLLVTLPLRSPETLHPFLKLLETNQSAETIAWMMLSAVIIAPIIEELVFRVMLQDGLARWMGSRPAIGISSVLFCAVHGYPDSIALLPLAIILGYVYDRTQSVLSVVLVHALFNLANIFILLLAR